MGLSELQDYFQNIYAERWPALFKALQQPTEKFHRPNLFSTSSVELPKEEVIPRGDEGLLHYYVMDPASVWAAKALQVQSGDKVLDMCAAPGGKSLVLFEALAEAGELIANEPSRPRRERLIKVFQQYVPAAIRQRVRVTGLLGGAWARKDRNYFDRVLVDAPCSGEAHLLQGSPERQEQWSPSQPKKLSQEQYALLSAALEVVKPSGRIVYSTCSINPQENDGVIDRLLKKKSERVKIISADPSYPSPEIPGTEKTKHGYQIFPDKAKAGPIYYTILEKIK